MLNLIRRFLNRNKPDRGLAPDFFEVPNLRETDTPSCVFMTKDMIRSIVSVRIIENYRDTSLRTVYFHAQTPKGEQYPVVTLNNRTPEEATNDIRNILQAIEDWCNYKPIVIVIDTKTFNKAA